MTTRRCSPVRLAITALVLAAAGTACTPVGSGRAPGTPKTATTASPQAQPYDPSRFAPQVVAHARQAGVSARLLMAILYNEAYKPHDPEWERAWQRTKPDAAFGIANMHKAAFDQTKRGRDFADRDWHELPDDRDLAIKAAAWYLHDLGRQLPTQRSGSLSRDELLALGYNTGAGNMRAFARGTAPGPQAQTYLDRLHNNGTRAQQALQHT
ncbi:lytic transglycosylase domain-containing protein [Streptomyces chrestomyceticus]|uniref:lytic transglycosylase domain-containing protein n=1 Tax=Streptomyces chrestomyceticus TaxID=68185 RepID=UPI0019D00451|nr:lytic transglycosylase domain-containing protein [Streptomyces chrestomyceticus]